MYLLLIIAAILFSVQFLFNQKFKSSRGDSIESVLCFSIYSSLMRIVLMLVLNKFNIQVTWFSLLMAAFYTALNILYTYFSLKAFSVANLSVFSIFAMLGGMILPFAAGTMLYDEELTAAKIACCVLILLALLLTFEKGRGTKQGILYCMGVFVMNGLVGVVSKLHQSSSLPTVDSYSFLAISAMLTVIVCSIWYFIKYRCRCTITKSQTVQTLLYSVCCSLGNLFCLIALQYLPASVQYPIITGGCMVFATVISIMNREKQSVKNIASAAIAFIATLLIMI